MRGWRYIGRSFCFYKAPWSSADSFVLDTMVAAPVVGDIVAFSPLEDGRYFRCGYARVREIDTRTNGLGPIVRFDGPLSQIVTAIAARDHLFAAIAIGEDAFRRPS